MASNGHSTADKEHTKDQLDTWHQFSKGVTWATLAVIVGVILLAVISL